MADKQINNINLNVKSESTSAEKAIDKLSMKMRSLSNSAKKVGSELGTRLSEKLSKVTGLFRALGRVAFYRVIRTILKTISQGFREGIDNAYQFSKIFGGDLSKSMDSMATSFLYLKNQIGAVFSSLYVAIAPAIEKIIDRVSVLTTWLSKLFAVMTGKNTYLIAKKSATEYAEALGEVEKAQRSLMGFDEINKLTGNNSGKSALDYSSMFEKKELDTAEFEKFANILERIKTIAIAIGVVFGAWKLAKMVTSVAQLGALINPIAIGIAALTALLVHLWNTDEGFKNSVITAWSEIKEALQPVVEVLLQALTTTLKGIAPILSSIFKALTPIINAVVQTILPVLTNIIEVVAPLLKFAIETIGKTLQKTFEIVLKVVNGSITVFKKLFNTLATPIENFFNFFLKGINTMVIKPLNLVIKGVGKIVGKNWEGIPTMSASVKLPRMASGGFVSEGQMFIAREAGAEMVGSIGNRTAVANNDQIVSAIKQGVYEAMSRAGSNVNVTLQGDTDKLFKVVQQKAKNYTYATGNPAF